MNANLPLFLPVTASLATVFIWTLGIYKYAIDGGSAKTVVSGTLQDF